MFEHVLVTGGAGFVGSSIALALRAHLPEIRVTAFDSLRRRGSELNVPRLRRAGVQFVHGDVRSAADLRDAAASPDMIVECSAEPSAQTGYGGGVDFLIHTNLTGCFHCLELARRTGAVFIFLSTSRVYPFALLNSLRMEEASTRFRLLGEQPVPGSSESGIAEEFALEGPRSLYGMTKLAAELMIREYGDAFGLRWIVNRCGLIAGPGQMGKTDQGVLVLWMAAHFFRRRLAYIGFGGTGKQVRDVLHVADLCDLILRQVTGFDKYQNRVFNAGGGIANTVSLREATEICREITGNAIPLDCVPETRPADIRHYASDNRCITSVDGWKPSRDVRQTMTDIFEWLRREESFLRDILSL